MPNPLPPSDPRRGKRKQWRPKDRPSDVRRRALRADPKLRQKLLDAVEVDPRVDAQVARDHARVRDPAEAKPDFSRRVRRTARMINESGAMYEPARTQGERRAAAILGAEMWRKQVTRVVTSIADRVEGMANMASNELAELGRKLQELTTRVASLEAAAALDAPQREQLSRRWAEIEALTRRARTSARKIGSLAGIRRQLAELTKFRNALLMRQVVTRSRRLNRKARKSGKVKA